MERSWRNGKRTDKIWTFDLDAIIEVGAIRVENGKLVETEELVFQELVRPYKKIIPPRVEEVTGISKDMVKDARQIYDVFNDFADFVGDRVLVGYNSRKFDSGFLVRAGRYARRIERFRHFDVLNEAEKYSKNNNLENAKPETVGQSLGIVNPEAHRALSDAITTAKVYLELKEQM